MLSQHFYFSLNSHYFYFTYLFHKVAEVLTFGSQYQSGIRSQVNKPAERVAGASAIHGALFMLLSSSGPFFLKVPNNFFKNIGFYPNQKRYRVFKN